MTDFFISFAEAHTVANHVIIVAGGSGARMNAALPKQFMLLNGRPVLMHSIEKFHAADPSMQIIVVLPQGEAERWKTICHDHHFQVAHEVAGGGETRFHSVRNGLAHVTADGVTGVHDAVRPLVSTHLITSCFRAAEQYGTAVPCLPVQDSLRMLQGQASHVADRSAFVAVQTPQCFRTALLKDAYQAEYRSSFTDDASVVESAGTEIRLMEGEQENIKITFPADLIVAEALLEMQQ